jgi:PAS domain S-box-containing protein
MLRERAEASLRGKTALSPENLAKLTPEAAQLMLHELQVHQIELEMQNEQLRQSQLALDAARTRYFDLYDLAPVGYCSVSETGLIIEANLTAATLLGMGRGALVRQPFSRFILKEDQDSYYLFRKHLLDIGVMQACEFRLVKRDGTPFWAHLEANVVHLAASPPVIRIVLSDIGARKMAEQAQIASEAFKLTILNSLSAEIAVVDRDGVIVAVNEPWRRFSLENGIEPGKSSPSTEVGANYLAVCELDHALASPDVVSACKGLRGVLNGTLPAFSMEYPCHSPTQQRWFMMNVLPLGVLEHNGAVISHTDITELKLLDQILQEKNVELERARFEADQANQAKSDFLSSMRHELRTPLNSILGFAQLIESGITPPTPAQKKSIDHILKAGWYLLELINEILDLALIESGKLSLTLQALPLAEVMNECQHMIEAQAKQRGIGVTFPRFETPCFVHADRTRVKQIVINLLSNAIKYNKAGGTVAVECTPGSPETIRISVRDSGVGLAAEQLAHIFQPFNRLGQESGAEPGTGIGLVVSKRLVECMGGSIGVESTPGQGSVFWFELKRMAQATDGNAAASNTTRPPDDPPRPLSTLLYIEDSPANLMLVEDLVSRRPDIRLLSAKDGNSGIERARIALPDVILMDIGLPGISGFQVLKMLAEDPATARIPVLAISANALPGDISKGLEAGFFRYLTKPFRVDEFMDTLDAALIFSRSDGSRGKE